VAAAGNRERGTRSFEEAAGRIRQALATRAPRRLAADGFRAAAVLVPLLRRPAGPTLLFTRRSEVVQEHKGEISFPGGHLEGAEDAAGAALREAREEVDLDPAGVEVLGQLDDRPSVTRYLVTPVVGLVAEPPASFNRQEREVHEVFEVPLSCFLSPDALRSEWWNASRLPPDLPRRPLLDLSAEEVDPATGRYRVYFFDIAPDRVIWGLTARLVKDLRDIAFR
jgi:8-oxo-dGTP pyrophosphatase MutT (NUDIX family)